MKVFLDTNVLVSAFATRGLCADLVRTVMMDHQLITGEVVLSELDRILTTKFRMPAPSVEDVLALLRGYPVQPMPEAVAEIEVRDAADGWVLASALAAGADVLVTGDQDLLVLGGVGGMKILSPRGFWEIRRVPRS